LANVLQPFFFFFLSVLVPFSFFLPPPHSRPFFVAFPAATSLYNAPNFLHRFPTGKRDMCRLNLFRAAQSLPRIPPKSPLFPFVFCFAPALSFLLARLRGLPFRASPTSSVQLDMIEFLGTGFFFFTAMASLTTFSLPGEGWCIALRARFSQRDFLQKTFGPPPERPEALFPVVPESNFSPLRPFERRPYWSFYGLSLLNDVGVFFPGGISSVHDVALPSFFPRTGLIFFPDHCLCNFFQLDPVLVFF